MTPAVKVCQRVAATPPEVMPESYACATRHSDPRCRPARYLIFAAAADGARSEAFQEQSAAAQRRRELRADAARCWRERAASLPICCAAMRAQQRARYARARRRALSAERRCRSAAAPCPRTRLSPDASDVRRACFARRDAKMPRSASAFALCRGTFDDAPRRRHEPTTLTRDTPCCPPVFAPLMSRRHYAAALFHVA